MKQAKPATGMMVSCVVLLGAMRLRQDWPQWRGPNRDAKATGFEAPKTWPKELTQKWKVKVGDGVATPALVGDKVYVFSREGEDEIIRCLDAEAGKELWQNKYPAQGATGPAVAFPGPTEFADRGRWQGRDAGRARHPFLPRCGQREIALAQR